MLCVANRRAWIVGFSLFIACLVTPPLAHGTTSVSTQTMGPLGLIQADVGPALSLPQGLLLAQGEDPALSDDEIIVDIMPAEMEAAPTDEVFSLAKRRRVAGVATAISITGGMFGFQGMGQLYNGQPGKAAAFLGLGWLSALTTITGYGLLNAPISLVGAVGYTAVWVGAAVDANRSAKRINAARGYTFLGTPTVGFAMLSPLGSDLGAVAPQTSRWLEPIAWSDVDRVPGLSVSVSF